jgi:shikimate kinase
LLPRLWRNLRYLSEVMKRGSAIVLIGCAGVGKSTVGRQLAAHTGFACYDTDEMIADKAGLTVLEIFAQRGEQEFRRLEIDALGKIPEEPVVIATGGGIVLRAENTVRLRSLGTVIWLTADEETLLRRVAQSELRPLLMTANPHAAAAELRRIRNPLYLAAADFAVDTSRLTVEGVVEAILKLIPSAPSRVMSAP